MDPKIQRWLDYLLEFAAAYGLRLIGGVLILVIGWVLSRWLGKKARDAAHQARGIDDTLAPFLGSLARFSILTIAVVAMLSAFGVHTASLITVVGAAGLAIGLALQGTLAHFASGVMLLLFRPFDVGDVVELGDTVGTVAQVGIFGTEVRPADGTYVLIPNGAVWGNRIRNLTRNGTRRVELVFALHYDADIEAATEALRALVSADARVFEEPAPSFAVTALGESSVELSAWFWVNAGEFGGAQNELRKAAKLRLETEGIRLAGPRLDVSLQQVA